jgi:transcriptional regulator with XRE-family HTH domain
MLARILEIMEDKGLNASTFSNEIEVNRTTILHVVAGRNKPSLDIVTKILERYKDISTDWLVFGKGVKYKSTAPFQQGLFDEPEAINHTLSKEEIVETDKHEATPSPTVNLHIDSKAVNQYKQINRIMVFYSDKSFETFIPETEDKMSL